MVHTRSRWVLGVTWALAIGSASVLADRVGYSGHSKARVFINDSSQIQWLEHNGIDVWSHGMAAGYVDVRLAPEQSALLDAQGFRYDILVPDLGPQVEAEYTRLQANANKRGEVWDYLDFHPYSVVIDYLNTLAATYPDFVEVMEFGTTIESRTVWGIKVTSPNGKTDKHGFLYFATQHAREWLTTPVPLFTADYLLQNYGSDPQATELLDNVEWYLVPVMNPDGYEYTWSNDRYWRKNRRDNEGSTFGVDLNRNWLFEWGGPGSDSNPGGETYRGTAPLSEPETQNMYNFVLAHPNIRAFMDMHSYGELVMWPWAWDTGLCPDDAALRVIGNAMQDAIALVHGNQYTAGPVGPTLYLAAGASIDTAYTMADPYINSFTIEVRGPDFVVPPTEILPNAEENMQAILTLVEKATAAFEITLPTGAPVLLSPTQSTTFDLVVSPIAETPVPGTEFVYYRTDGLSDFVASPMTSTGENTYEASIPALGCGDSPQFYVSITGSGGTVVTSPAGAPGFLYDAVVGDADALFTDNFETDLGWTDSGSATAGHWNRGIPAGDGSRGDPPTDFDGSGQCELTGNAAGNSDVDAGNVILTSAVLDLTGLTDPRVSYARWFYNNGGPSPQSEVFLVEVSDDAGASWVTLETIGPTGDEVIGGWFFKDFAISDFIDPTSQFRIRFTATDNSPETRVEAAIDAVTVYQVLCESTACEGDTNGDGQVDPLDAGYVLARFGCSVGTGDADCDAADQNGDNLVDLLDVGFVQSRFGVCP